MFISMLLSLFLFLYILLNGLRLIIVQCDGTGRCVRRGFEAGPGASWIGRGYLGFSPLSCGVFVYLLSLYI